MSETKHTREELKQWQALPLSIKLLMTQDRIRQWVKEYGEDGVYVSFSGGKDSTVLLDIARKMYPNIVALFSNTGLEYPEIQRFVRKYDNVDIVTPEMRFTDVITQYGYPLISKEVAEAIHYARKLRGEAKKQCSEENSFTETKRAWYNYNSGERKRAELNGFKTGVTKGGVFSNNDEPRSQFSKEKYLPIARDLPVKISHYCCNKLKKLPIKKWQNEHKMVPIIGTMAEESRIRTQGWLRTGCNAFDPKAPKSTPLAFWTNQDVLQYVIENSIEIASVYGEIVTVDAEGMQYYVSPLNMGCGKLKCTGCERTGCIFCGFGFHNERGETRFQRLAKTHPRQYEYAIRGGQWVDNPDYDPTAPKMDGEWQNWNPKKIWVPSEKGLGMGKVFDMCNEIMGEGFYRWQ